MRGLNKFVVTAGAFRMYMNWRLPQRACAESGGKNYILSRPKPYPCLFRIGALMVVNKVDEKFRRKKTQRRTFCVSGRSWICIHVSAWLFADSTSAQVDSVR